METSNVRTNNAIYVIVNALMVMTCKYMYMQAHVIRYTYDRGLTFKWHRQVMERWPHQFK